MEKINEIKELLTKPRTPCDVCVNSCGNEEAYIDSDGRQCSCGWKDCFACHGTGETPNDTELISQIKEILGITE